MKRILIWLIVVLMAIATADVANAAAKKSKKKKKVKKAPVTYVVSAPEPAIAPAVEAAPIAPVAEVPPKLDDQNVGYDGGFFIKSPDDNFKFTVNGRLQPKVYLTKTTGTDSAWSFAIQRARMDFGATTYKIATFNLSFNYGTNTALFKSINMYNTTVDLNIMPELTISVGTVGLPLGFKASSTAWLMIDPALAVSRDDGGTPLTPLRSSFGAPDGIGVEAAGGIGKFFYDFAIVNGATQAKPAVQALDVNGNSVTISAASGGVESNYDLNFNKKVSAGLRVGYNILGAVPGIEMDLPYSEKPKLTISLGGDYQGARTDPNNNAEIKRLLTGASSAAFRWRGWSINTELFGRRTYLSSLGTAQFGSLTLDDMGYYINSGYFVIPNKLEIAALVSQIFREGPNNNSYQMGGGINWYIKGNKIKLQTAYNLQVAYDDITQVEPGKAHSITMMLGTSF